MSDDGLRVALNDAAIQVHDDHVLRSQRLIANARRLDRHQAALPIQRADIAAGPSDQVVLRQLHVQQPEFFA